MALVSIDTQIDVGLYRLRVILDETAYLFDFKFNSRDQFWYFDLLQDNETRIMSGKKIVTNTPLFRLVTDLARPQGSLMALDATGQIDTPRRDNVAIGSDIELTYEEAATLAAAIA